MTEADEDAAAAKILGWTFLLGCLALDAIGQALYTASGADPSPRFKFVMSWAFTTFLWSWLRSQCRPHRGTFPLDLWLFLFGAWPVVLPYYLWRHERWRGLGKCALVLAACAASAAATFLLAAMLAAIVG